MHSEQGKWAWPVLGRPSMPSSPARPTPPPPSQHALQPSAPSRPGTRPLPGSQRRAWPAWPPPHSPRAARPSAGRRRTLGRAAEPPPWGRPWRPRRRRPRPPCCLAAAASAMGVEAGREAAGVGREALLAVRRGSHSRTPTGASPTEHRSPYARLQAPAHRLLPPRRRRSAAPLPAPPAAAALLSARIRESEPQLEARGSGRAAGREVALGEGRSAHLLAARRLRCPAAGCWPAGAEESRVWAIAAARKPALLHSSSLAAFRGWEGVGVRR